MIGLAVALFLDAQAGDPLILKGICSYPADAPKPGETRYDCTRLVLAQGRDDADVLAQFGGVDGTPVGFAGPVEGDIMTVRRIYPSPGKMIPATGGRCKLFTADDAIVGLACVGRAGTRTFVANFRTDGH